MYTMLGCYRTKLCNKYSLKAPKKTNLPLNPEKSFLTSSSCVTAINIQTKNTCKKSKGLTADKDQNVTYSILIIV